MDFSAISPWIPLALALIAALGYFVGRRAGKTRDERAARSQREIRQARSVVREMEKISRSLRKSVSRQRGDLRKIKERAGQLDAPWEGQVCAPASYKTVTTFATTFDQAAGGSDADDVPLQPSDHTIPVIQEWADSLADGPGDRDSNDALLTCVTALAQDASGTSPAHVVAPGAGQEYVVATSQGVPRTTSQLAGCSTDHVEAE